MKILKIAFYDMKRLLKNPITLFACLGVLIVSIIIGFCFSPTITPALTLAYETEDSTAESLYDDFKKSTFDDDTKLLLDDTLYHNLQILRAENSNDLATTFNSLKESLLDLMTRAEAYYISDTVPTSDIISTDVAIKNDFANFLNEINETEFYYRSIHFTENEMETLNSVSEILNNLTETTEQEQIKNMYKLVWEGNRTINSALAISPKQVEFSDEIYEDLQTTYYSNVVTKLGLINDEIEEIYTTSKDYDSLKSLILNYKNQVISAEKGLKIELYYLMDESGITGEELSEFDNSPREEINQELALISFQLEDDSLAYKDYLSPMNFNTAYGEENAYDYAYYLISIIGFMLIILAIYFTYKLFGQDRRNGKMDVILAQNVSFAKVFAGKFLAILFTTSVLLLLYAVIFLLFGYFIYGFNFTSVLSVFNYQSIMIVSPILLYFIKLLTIELQVVYFTIISIFIMNLSRKFELMLGISIAVFAVAFILNTFLSGFVAYTFFPFIHADWFTYFGGGNSNFGFLNTTIVAGGNLFISIAYYAVLMIALYNFTLQLFKKN